MDTISKLHIFHHNDADGRLSAAIVLAGAPRDEYFPLLYEMGYETRPDFSQIDPGDKVFVVDFSFKDDVFDRLRSTGAAITWIDHHKACADSRHLDLRGLRDFTPKGPAACQLTWRYMFPHTEAPPAVFYVGDYDSWAHTSPDSTAFYEAAKAEPALLTPMGWAEWLKPSSSEGEVKEMIERGRAMIAYRDGFCANARKVYGYPAQLVDNRWYVEGGGLAGTKPITAYAMNLVGFGSLALGEEINSYPLVIAYVHNGHEIVVSLYSTNPAIDCSVIAKAFGGGGHKGAAGFRCQALPWARANEF